MTSFASGGLGASRQDWEARHGAPDGATNGLWRYGEGRYLVMYQGERVQNLTCYPERYSGGVPPADATEIAKALIPADAKLRSHRHPYQDDAGYYDVYSSTSLAEQLPDGPWGDAAPGTFLVLYKIEGGRAHTILVGTGSAP